MATLLGTYNLLTAQGQELRNRHLSAVMLAARTVLLEDAGTVNHVNRLAWAQYTVYSTAHLNTMAEKMFIALVTDSTIADIGNAATDAQIQASVTGVINFYANQFAAGV